MVVDLKLCRFESAPWGFRLVGGSDFEYPLTVVKVTEGSLAEQAGMKVGDVIVRINDEPAINLSHTEAHQVLSHCGNSFFLGVLREEEEIPENEIQYEEYFQRISTPDTLLESSGKSSVSEIVHEQDDKEIEMIMKNNEFKSDIETEEEPNVTEVEIAEMISGEAEILKEHNVIGVNFNRIFPKAGICQSSEVFRTLNEEAVKTKIEMEKDKRKWTTFLQKPNRPIPKTKQEMEEEKRVQYRVQIVKQPKPRVAPGRTPTPPPEPVPEPEPEPEPEQPVEEEQPIPEDSEVPNLEPINNSDEISMENQDQLENIENSTEEAPNYETIAIEELELQQIEVPPQKTEEELLLEKQLANVQKQLLALSTLPSTIQATLDSVTKQLAELLPSFRLQPSPKLEIKNEKEQNISVIQELTENGISHESEQENVEEIEESFKEQNYNIDSNGNIEETQEISEINQELEEYGPHEPTEEEIEQDRLSEEQRKLEEELNYKKQKEQEILEEEHKQRLIRQRTPKRPPRPFGPLTPQERPLVLPGGRKWRNAKDAFNDEFIAEVLSSQAELIVGTTLGVNFLKYQKPEKRIDLEKSEVYKVVHHLEKQPKRGIEVRPSKVLAEADVRNCATPISCN